MRPTFVHLIVGLGLGTALAVSLVLPGRLVIAGKQPVRGLTLPRSAARVVVEAAPPVRPAARTHAEPQPALAARSNQASRPGLKPQLAPRRPPTAPPAPAAQQTQETLAVAPAPKTDTEDEKPTAKKVKKVKKVKKEKVEKPDRVSSKPEKKDKAERGDGKKDDPGRGEDGDDEGGHGHGKDRDD
jgi:outer membrane biosynthesis protein TonB